MADVTWRPEVVEAVALAMWTEGEELCGPHEFALAALSASPLPDALDLIQRMLDGRRGARADARAFLARVRGA